MIFRGFATSVLAEALLRRGTRADVDEAHKTVETLAAVPQTPVSCCTNCPSSGSGRFSRGRAATSAASGVLLPGSAPGPQRSTSRGIWH